MKTKHIVLAALYAATILAGRPTRAQTVTERISGASYVNFGKDKTGLHSYSNAGIMCVVHDPSCGGGGHNGKDHYFPLKLPDGVQLVRIDYKAFWPYGLTHTDRGGWGSSGSYGEDESQQSTPPLASVHWQNACESPWPPSGKNWSGMKVTYQISFIVSHPRSITLKDPAVSADSPFVETCAKADQPPTTAPAPTPLAPLTVYLVSQGTWFEGTFSELGATGKLLTVHNAENFALQILADKNVPGGCANTGNTALAANATVPGSQLYGSSVSYPKVIGACAPSALTPGRQSVAVVVTYQPN